MMDEFPFTQAEWQRVSDTATALINASLAEDSILRDSWFAELQAVLAELHAKYGDHPVLLETEADFHDDPHVRRDMYLSAIRIAIANTLPTYSIRISLAWLLLDDFKDPIEAKHELTACEPELAQHADDWEREEWSELVRECDERLAGARAE
jgi:hypothetical protein